MIETIAITIGTNARNEANTNASTSERAEAAEHRLEQHAGPVAAAPLSSTSASKPVRCTGCAGDRGALQRRARRLLGLRVLAERRVRVGLRVDEREGRAAVLRDERAVAGRGVGGDPRAGQRLRRASRRPARGRRARRANRRVLPCGSVTTGTSGACRRPCRGSAGRSSTFVSQPSLSGTENSWVERIAWRVRRPRPRRS